MRCISLMSTGYTLYLWKVLGMEETLKGKIKRLSL
jgi:hypothetical protein